MTREVVKRTDGKTIDIPIAQAEKYPELTKKMENYSSGQPKYIGEAMPGTATSAAKWRIRLMEYDDGTTKPPTGEIWADGTSNFVKVWDDRDSYSYS